MSARSLFEWVRDLVADLPIVTPRDPDPPFYDDIPTGPEHDRRRLLKEWAHALPDEEVEALMAELGTWLGDLDLMTELGHELAHRFGVATGAIEHDDFAEQTTAKLRVLFAQRWRTGELPTLPDDTPGPDIALFLPRADSEPAPLPPPPLPLLDVGDSEPHRRPLPLLTAGPTLPTLPQEPATATPAAAIEAQPDRRLLPSIVTGAVLGAAAMLAVWFAVSMAPSFTSEAPPLHLTSATESEPLPVAESPSSDPPIALDLAKCEPDVTAAAIAPAVKEQFGPKLKTVRVRSSDKNSKNDIEVTVQEVPREQPVKSKSLILEAPERAVFGLKDRSKFHIQIGTDDK